jgi:hypothetical protein
MARKKNIDVESAYDLLGEALSGQHYDPSWIRAERLTQAKRTERIVQAFHLLGRVLGKENRVEEPVEKLILPYKIEGV